jgi:exopolysaccharide production protein ExoY
MGSGVSLMTDGRATTGEAPFTAPTAELPIAVTYEERLLRPRRRPWAAKRLLDLVIGVPLLLLGFPVMLLAGLAVLVVDRHWPLFAETRIGKDGKSFRCLKLRSMRRDPAILEAYLEANPDEAERYQRTRKLSRDPRITPLGKFLRKSSLDELPQLLNVVAGQMSLVGPRPLAPAEFRRRGRFQQPLMEVRPGLTGLWQVNGRSDLPLRRRIALDTYYARRWTIRLDLLILLRTPLAVLQARGAR